MAETTDLNKIFEVSNDFLTEPEALDSRIIDRIYSEGGSPSHSDHETLRAPKEAVTAEVYRSPREDTVLYIARAGKLLRHESRNMAA